MKQFSPFKAMLMMAVMILATAIGVKATPFPHPKVAYSADMVMQITSAGTPQPHTMSGRVYVTKDKERREVNSLGRRMAFIKDRETGTAWTLMPDQKMAMPTRGPAARKDPVQMIRDGEMTITKVGSERINGRMTSKYKVESTEKGSATFSGHAWLTKDNIPVRFAGNASEKGMRQTIRIDYTNIIIGRQNPALFTVPADYRQTPGAMGIPGQGMPPEQMQQMMEMLKKQQSAN